MTVSKAMEVLRLAASAALLGACLMGVVMGFAGYRGEELENWRMVGAATFFLPGLLLTLRMLRQPAASEGSAAA